MLHGGLWCTLLLVGACVSRPVAPPVCALGATQTCVCPGGSTSLQTCVDGARWDLCACPVDAGPRCAPGSLQTCACVDGRTGSQACVATGDRLGRCNCDGDVGPPCVPHDEICDGTDHDCDGVVDEDWFCPDDRVSGYTEPVEGGVWLHTDSGLQRIWPETGEVREVSSPSIGAFGFRPSDGSVLYEATRPPWRNRLYREESTGLDAPVPTPPCEEFVGHFAFDDADRLHYWCGTVRRDGDAVTGPVDGFITVLGGGESVAFDMRGERGPAYVLFDTSGREISRAHLGEWPGAYYALRGSTVQNGRAWVAWLRGFRRPDGSEDPSRYDIVVMAVDATGDWQFVRRVRLGEFWNGLLAASDGAVFLARRRDPSAGPCVVERWAPGSHVPEVIWTGAPGSGCPDHSLAHGP
jgi:hypothetical protein